MGGSDLTVVLPTLNEEKAIGPVIEELHEEGYENILVVDGHSDDRTVEIARDKGVEVMFQNGKGKADAVRTVIDRVDSPYMLFMDADWTYPAKDISKFLKNAEEYDQVIGNRTDRDNIPVLHRIGNRIISSLLSFLTGKRLDDPCSGMFLLDRERAESLELTRENFEIEAEIVGQVASYGPVKEVPIEYRERKGEKKLKTWRDFFKILKSIFLTAWTHNPVFLIGLVGSIFFFPGGIILIRQLWSRWLYGSAGWSLGWLWLGLILLIVGIQGLSLSAMSLMLKRVERRIIRRETK